MLKAELFYQDNFRKASKLNIDRAKMDRVAKASRDKDFEQIVSMIQGSRAKAQFIALASLYCIAVENCQQPRDLDPADGVIFHLGENVARYGEGAYQLSEAQVKLAVGKIIGKI